MVDLFTNLPFEKDAEIYKVLQFKWIESTDTFQVVLNIVDKERYRLDTPTFLIPYKMVTIDLPNNVADPAEYYHPPSVLYYVDVNGIHFATMNMRKFLGIPLNARMCFQCEYDEYIWKKVESGEFPKTASRFYNWAVWNAYCEYQLNETKKNTLVIEIPVEEDIVSVSSSLSYSTDDSDVQSLYNRMQIEECSTASLTDSDEEK
jgi:hypothetical protein